MPDMVANVNNGGRWHHVGGERAIKRALRDQHAVVIEAQTIYKTFVVSYRHLTIVRVNGSLGGHASDIECAWVYNNDIKLRQDEQELRSLSRMDAFFG